MTLQDFLLVLDDEVQKVLTPDFEINTVDTKFVPSDGDPSLTYENFDRNDKTCKYIETCVLFVDIRGSTLISSSHQAHTLAKLYSVFVSCMIKAGRYYEGHIRGIIGDRVMVVFDQEDCFKNAVDTAILMNTISSRIINKNFKKNTVRCGIGIDYGKLLVTKTGIVRRGIETSNYKSLVWLGRATNIASKLTDLANKSHGHTEPVVQVKYKNPFRSPFDLGEIFGNVGDKGTWKTVGIKEFFNIIEPHYSPNCAVYKDPNIESFFLSSEYVGHKTPPILMTKDVFLGFKKEAPNADSIKKKLWRHQPITVTGYNGTVFGGNVIKTIS